MGPVRGLVLGRHVPPWVIMDDNISRGQVKARSPCLQADQEYRDIIPLELSHHPDPLFLGRGPRKLVAGHAFLYESPLNQFQHGCELGKQKDLVLS